MTDRVLLLRLQGIEKRRIAGIEGEVSPATMARVEEALRIATGLRRV